MTSYAPAPGAAPLARMVLAQASLELRLLLRNGEQLLLTIAIPVLLLTFLVAAGDRALDDAVPAILALAVFSTAFTGQAIATGFDRRYGVLKRLGSTPLPRWGLLAGKTIAVLAVEALQLALVAGLGLALGWRPHGSPLLALLVLVLGTAASSGLGLLMAGTLRAEATLAAANLVYVVLLLVSGVVLPLDRFPAAARPWLEATPLGALVTGLRDALSASSPVPWASLAVLAGWAVVAGGGAGISFRWD